MGKKLPTHLKKIIDTSMKTNKGRESLAKVIGAEYYKKKSGKIKKLK